MNAFRMDGITPAGASLGPVHLSGGGHTAAYAGEFISGLPDGFKGVLDVSATTPFVALTLRSLYNARQDFLLTTFPIADFNQTPVSPLVFPQIASGGGYQTEIILLSISAGAPSTLTIRFYGTDGAPLALMATGN
jgi:hypothetical protein